MRLFRRWLVPEQDLQLLHRPARARVREHAWSIIRRSLQKKKLPTGSKIGLGKYREKQRRATAAASADVCPRSVLVSLGPAGPAESPLTPPPAPWCPRSPAMSGQRAVSIPDDRAFASFKAECLCEDGWTNTYSKHGITVWSQEVDNSVHKIKVRPSICSRPNPPRLRASNCQTVWDIAPLVGHTESLETTESPF